MERHQKPSPWSRYIFFYRCISFGSGTIKGPGIFLVFDLARTLWPRLHGGTSVGRNCRRFGRSHGSWRSRTASGRRYARAVNNMTIRSASTRNCQEDTLTSNTAFCAHPIWSSRNLPHGQVKYNHGNTNTLRYEHCKTLPVDR